MMAEYQLVALDLVVDGDAEKLKAELEALKRQGRPRGVRKARERMPDDLMMRAEAALKLGCSAKTLNGHIESGALR